MGGTPHTTPSARPPRQPLGRPALPEESRAGTSTYRLLELALVALDLALQLVNQVLHPCQVLPVFFSLQVPPTQSAGPRCWCETPQPCSGCSCPSASSPRGSRALCSHQPRAMWADPLVSHAQPRRCHKRGRGTRNWGDAGRSLAPCPAGAGLGVLVNVRGRERGELGPEAGGA